VKGSAYGRLPNSAYIIAKGEPIVHKEAWAQPDGWPEILKDLLKARGETSFAPTHGTQPSVPYWARRVTIGDTFPADRAGM
jgi:hypothetical protein